jgi:hypothetical protein
VVFVAAWIVVAYSPGWACPGDDPLYLYVLSRVEGLKTGQDVACGITSTSGIQQLPCSG